LRARKGSENTGAAYRVAAFQTFLSGRISTFGDTQDKVLVGTGFSAEDLVNDTIVKALGGDEIRYRAERGELFQLLRTAMIRDFIDLRRKRSHQRNVHVDLTAQEAEKDARLRDRAGDERGKAAALLQDVRRLVEGDLKLTEYVEAVDLGCGTPAEIADVCQVSVGDVYERRRKLKKAVLTHFIGGRRDEEESA
jgi:DNA-directed RNA polymerase specialized sigma24 family protein